MDVKDLKYFVAVFDVGSISKAAERENCSQPGLSAQVRNLEHILGGPLFERSVAGIVPTADYKQKLFNEGWSAGDTINTSIGQGFMEASPLQLALHTAAIANGERSDFRRPIAALALAPRRLSPAIPKATPTRVAARRRRQRASVSVR